MLSSVSVAKSEKEQIFYSPVLHWEDLHHQTTLTSSIKLMSIIDTYGWKEGLYEYALQFYMHSFLMLLLTLISGENKS